MERLHNQKREGERERVGIICWKIFGDLALEAWTQSDKEKRECVCVSRERERANEMIFGYNYKMLHNVQP